MLQLHAANCCEHKKEVMAAAVTSSIDDKNHCHSVHVNTGALDARAGRKQSGNRTISL